MDVVMQATIHNNGDHLLLFLPHSVPLTIPAIAYVEKGVGKYLCIFSYNSFLKCCSAAGER